MIKYCQKARLLSKLDLVNCHLLLKIAGGGDEKGENATRILFERALSKRIDEHINICYYSDSALRVSTRLFCEKWSDFCYPSDCLIIDYGEKALLYYEDRLYYLDQINKT